MTRTLLVIFGLTFQVGPAAAAPPDGRAAARTIIDPDAVAEQIDTLIEANLQRHELMPNPVLTDEQFVRRIYLDVVGRIPTVDEARRFLDSKEPNRRTKLIDELLRSEGYVSHYFNYWADVLRARNASFNLSSYADETLEATYTFWIKQALRENKPYDDFVFELLTAEGSLSFNGATGYYLRDEGNRLANYEATTAVFLGVQLECAQCHDHPYDEWTQRQYHEGLAFISKTISLRAPDSSVQEIVPHVDVEELRRQERELLRKLKQQREASGNRKGGKTSRGSAAGEPSEGLVDQEARRALGGYENHYVRFMDKDGSSLPRDFRGTDGKAGDKIRPKTIYGDVLDRRADETWPETYARWLTSRDNPRFALVVANRLWTKLFGLGVAGSPTETQSIEQSSNPELTRLLVQTMLDVDFDLRRFLGILCRTRTYQRAATTGEIAGDVPYRFPGPTLRRMSAEQIWDSLVVSLRDPSCDERLQRQAPSRDALDELRNVKSSEEFWALMRERARRRLTKADENRRLVRSAETQYLRASELGSPAPAGHFLRVFGQSERALVDKAWSNPTVPQALMLLNGPLFEAVTADDAALMRSLHAAATPEAKVAAAFLAVVSHEPTPEELRLSLAAIHNGAEYDYDQLLWSLLNSRQFLFVR